MLGYVIAAVCVIGAVVYAFVGNIAGALLLGGAGAFCAWATYEAIKADKLLKELENKEKEE